MTYLEWLTDQIEYFDAPTEHNFLLERLHFNSFISALNRDENRAADGIRIRDDYYEEYGGESIILDSPCSFLEFLFALAKRMNYIYARSYEDCTRDMFWNLIDNLGLLDFDDDNYENLGGDAVVDQAVFRINNRAYDECGIGGLFPMPGSTINQRNIEIWYQMNQYLVNIMRKEGRV